MEMPPTIRICPDTGRVLEVRETVRELDCSGFTALVRANVTTIFPMLAPGDFVAYLRTHALIIHELTDIPFHTAVTVGADEHGTPVYLPDYFDNEGVKSDDIKLVFNPPVGQRLYLVIHPEETTSYIVAQDVETGRLYYPALPNVYANGNLCTGEAPLPSYRSIWTVGTSGYLLEWLQGWSQCDFNADLNDSGEGTVERACVFDAKTGNNIPVTNWQSVYRPLSPASEVSDVMALLWERLKEK